MQVGGVLDPANGLADRLLPLRCRQRAVVPADVDGSDRRLERARRPRYLAVRGDGGQPGVARTVPAEDRPRHHEHRAVGRVVEREGAERDQARAPAAHRVVDVRAVGDLAEPLLRGGEPVRAQRAASPARPRPTRPGQRTAAPTRRPPARVPRSRKSSPGSGTGTLRTISRSPYESPPGRSLWSLWVPYGSAITSNSSRGRGPPGWPARQLACPHPGQSFRVPPGGLLAPGEQVSRWLAACHSRQLLGSRGESICAIAGSTPGATRQ